MSDTRAAKSGLALEAQKKLKAKYDDAVAASVMEWVLTALKTDDAGASLDVSGDQKSVRSQLKDGFILLKLYKAIVPSTDLSKTTKGKLPFHVMERIGSFVDKVKGAPLCIPDYCVFQTVDLYEDEGNLAQVITCLEAIGRKCHSIETQVPGFGAKESEGHKRHFTEEQLAQGKSVIGLQMGSNKGATQAGQAFGKTRMITD